MPAVVTTNVDGVAESQVVGAPEPTPDAPAPAPEAPPSDAAPADEQGTPAESAPANETQPDSETDESEEDLDDETTSPLTQRAFKRRLNRAIRARRDAERELAEQRARNDALLQLAAGKQLAPDSSGSPQPTQPVAAQPTRPRPTEDQYPTHAEYIEAIADWKAEQRVAQALADREAREAKARQDAALQAAQEAFAATEDAARQVYEDYDEVIHAARIQVTDALNHGIMSSDVGGHLYYYLSRHPAEVRRLNAITDPVKLGRELGKLEAQVVPAAPSPRSSRTSTPTVVTRAAPPPTALGAVTAASTTVNYDTMSFKDYEAHARQRRQAGGRR